MAEVQRNCTACNARRRKAPARFVARDAAGLEWFECGNHGPQDNVARTTRTALVHLSEWLAAQGLGRN